LSDFAAGLLVVLELELATVVLASTLSIGTSSTASKTMPSISVDIKRGEIDMHKIEYIDMLTCTSTALSTLAPTGTSSGSWLSLAAFSTRLRVGITWLSCDVTPGGLAAHVDRRQTKAIVVIMLTLLMCDM